MRIIPVLLAASLVAACASEPPLGPSDTRIAGTWVQSEPVSGTLFVLNLDLRRATVTGTGTYTVAGGRSGTLTTTGTIANGAISLEILYDSGAAAQFAGQQVSDSELSGSLHLGPAQSLTPAHLVTFHRRD